MFGLKKRKYTCLKVDFWRGDIWALMHAVETVGYEITSYEQSSLDSDRMVAVVRRRGPIAPTVKAMLKACKSQKFEAGYNVAYW